MQLPRSQGRRRRGFHHGFRVHLLVPCANAGKGNINDRDDKEATPGHLLLLTALRLYRSRIEHNRGAATNKVQSTLVGHVELS
jgi:hypothetical protein